jgi:hypothetical protein
MLCDAAIYKVSDSAVHVLKGGSCAVLCFPIMCVSCCTTQLIVVHTAVCNAVCNAVCDKRTRCFCNRSRGNRGARCW